MATSTTTTLSETTQTSRLRASLPDPSAPPDQNPYNVQQGINAYSAQEWSSEKEKAVRGPFDYITSQPGKNFRAALIDAFNAWLDVSPASLEIITRVIGMLHESSLLIDDVQDSSELRRGVPVAHKIFGVAQTINSANYMYFAALQELLKLNLNLKHKHDVVGVFVRELVNLHRGQGMDLFWRDTLTCPTEAEYLDMVSNKTGGLLRLGVGLMQAESESSAATAAAAAAVGVEEDCVLPLANLIGLIFQIRDDYMNLSSREYSSNKGMCEDLTEGKFSFPVIHSIRADPANRQLINILKQKTNDVDVKRWAVRYMEGTGSFEYTRQVVRALIDQAKRMAERIDRGRGKLGGMILLLDSMAI